MLKGTEIYLRTLEPSDADQLLEWENDSDNWRASDTRVPFSRHLIAQYVNAAQDIFETRQIRFMVCLNKTNQVIGSIDLFDYEPIHQRVGVGILIDRNFRQTGYAFAALQILSNYALNGLGVRNLYCSIMGDNSASKALFRKAGYQEIGCRKNWFNDKGAWVDEYLFQKLLVE